MASTRSTAMTPLSLLLLLSFLLSASTDSFAAAAPCNATASSCTYGRRSGSSISSLAYSPHLARARALRAVGTPLVHQRQARGVRSGAVTTEARLARARALRAVAAALRPFRQARHRALGAPEPLLKGGGTVGKGSSVALAHRWQARQRPLEALGTLPQKRGEGAGGRGSVGAPAVERRQARGVRGAGAPLVRLGQAAGPRDEWAHINVVLMGFTGVTWQGFGTTLGR